MNGKDNGDPSPEYEVKIEGEGLTLVRQVSEAKVARLLGILLEAGVGSGGVSASTGVPEAVSGECDKTGTRTTAPDGEPEKSIAQYMSDLRATSNPQRIAAIALYHRDILNKGTVRKDQLPKWFEKAGRSAPKNLSRDLKNAVKRNLIAESTTEENHYYPTSGAKDKLLEDDG